MPWSPSTKTGVGWGAASEGVDTGKKDDGERQGLEGRHC